MNPNRRPTNTELERLILSAAVVGILCLLSWKLLAVGVCLWLLYRLWC